MNGKQHDQGREEQVLGPSEPCWCGSGRKYKKCHLDTDHSIPITAIYNDWRNSKIRTCCHPNASDDQCGPIIAAHTIQRRRVLGSIVDTSNHLFTFHPNHGKPLGPRQQPYEVGWNEASTFTGFCSTHDSSTFSPLEQHDFIGSIEQCILHSYRAICYELLAKRRVLAGLDKPMKKMLRRVSVSERISGEASNEADVNSTKLAIVALEREKTQLEEAFTTKNYTEYAAHVLHFVGEPFLASTGAFSCYFDVDGQLDQESIGSNAPLNSIYVATDISDGNPCVVFAWRKEHVTSEAFVASLVARDAAFIEQGTAQIILRRLENNFFSKRWWSQLSDAAQEYVRKLSFATIDEPLEAVTLATWKLDATKSRRVSG